MIIDENGNMHMVNFNGDYNHPLLTHGWSQLRSFYGFECHKEIILCYSGQNDFVIYPFDSAVTDTGEIPSYHNMSTAPGEIVCFDVTLSKFQMEWRKG